MSKSKTSIVFTGDIGFDRYMDKRWEDENLLSRQIPTTAEVLEQEETGSRK